MTALSHFMGDLSCAGSTPRRKLSLSEGGDTPVTSFSRHSSESSDAGVSVSSIDTDDSELTNLSASEVNSVIGRGRRSKHAFRRFNSNPSSCDPSFSSPLFIPPEITTSASTEIKAPPLDSPSEEDELIYFSAKSSSSDCSKTEEVPSSSFTAIRSLPSDSSSPKQRPYSAPATLLNQGRVQTTVDEDDSEPLQQSRLTSSNDDDEDDGFCDFFDSDSQGSNSEELPRFAGLLHNPILANNTSKPSDYGNSLAAVVSPPAGKPLQTLDCNAMDITPEPKCRRGIFKVPSQPAIKRSNSFLKRPERPRDTPSPIMKKKARSQSVASPNPGSDVRRVAKQKKMLIRSFSTTDADMKRIEQKLSLDAQGLNFLGDGSQGHLLPLVNGCHKDLKCIEPEILAQLIRQEYSEDVKEFFIVDARYPYEFRGGHIKGAINLYTREKINEFFLDHPMTKLDKRRLIIFHCEFSSQRAPSLLKYLREEDRNANLENYPDLFYPEMYLLDGGYKNFFEKCKDYCEPQAYKPMLHKDHGNDLKHFKAKSKSWTGGSRLKLKDKFK